jgi:hypothetical protein
MFYHIRATIKTNDATDLQTYITAFQKKMEQQKKWTFVKKLDYTFYTNESNQTFLFCQSWLDMSLVNERLDIFTKLKTFVASRGGTVDWHECHNEENQPCVISESYTV